MRRYFLMLALLAIAILIWWLLGGWMPGGTERFYLLVPPVFLAGWFLVAPDAWKTCTRNWRSFLQYVLFLLVLCTGYNLYMAYVVLPPSQGGIVRGLSAMEIVAAAYFVGALRLLVMVPTTAVRACMAPRSSQPAEPIPAQPTPRETWRAMLARNAIALLCVPLLAPFFLGALYIHRFKVPNPTSPTEWTGRPAENIELRTDDGLTLRGWFIPAVEPSARTLLICHGLGANRSNFLPFLRVGDGLGANVLLFDFRGHGDSDGHTVSYGFHERKDVHAAICYLRQERRDQSEEVIGLGVSMGTAGLILAAAEVEPPLNAVIIDSGMTAPTELTDSVLTLFPPFVRPIMTGAGIPTASLHAGCWLPAVRPIDHVHRLRAPVLFIHSRGDPVIPVAHGERLHERAAEPKALWITQTEQHASSLTAQAEYLRQVIQVVERGRN